MVTARVRQGTGHRLARTPQEAYKALFNASPVARHLGLDLKQIGAGRSRLEVQSDERHRNLQGDVQGGILATMVDSSMSGAVRSLIDEVQRLATIELTVNYLHPAEVGDLLVAEGEVLRMGAHVAVARTLVRTASGVNVAAGQGTFMVLPGYPGRPGPVEHEFGRSPE